MNPTPRPLRAWPPPVCRTFLAVGLGRIQGNRIKPKSPLQLKKALQSERDARLQHELAQAKQAERAADIGPTKRRANDFLAQYVTGARLDALRSEDGYRAKTYNLSRQILGLVDHLFVRYPVPLFLYRSVLTRRGLELVFEAPSTSKKMMERDPPEAKYRDWFFAVAQGRSFAKASKDVFTKREAHFFLLAPGGNSIERNILWARLAAAGLAREGCDYLAERLDAEFLALLGDRLPDVIRFYVEAWPQMRAYDRDEITDYIRAAGRDRAFSYKGRTFGSMRKLCHEWHRTVYVGRVNEYRTWVAGFALWEHRKKDHLVRAEELTNNRALNDEGRVQHHCVFTYTSKCMQGVCRIVSIRWLALPGSAGGPTVEKARLTLEIAVARREIVQIRGKANRWATNDEMNFVRMWAGDMGLLIGPHA